MNRDSGFLRRREQLMHDLRNLKRCLVCSLVSKHFIFAFVSTDQVLSNALGVFPTDSMVSFQSCKAVYILHGF